MEPWDLVGVDTVPAFEDYPSPEGYTQILVIVDFFTCFVVLRAIKDKTAVSVAQELLKLFSEFGFPKQLMSDRGKEFVATLTQSLLSAGHISHRVSAEYVHSQNGRVERSISTVLSSLRKMLGGNPREWYTRLPLVQMAYNVKVSTVTKCDPFTLMFGRRNNILSDTRGTIPVEIGLDQWIAQQKQLVELIYPAVARDAELKRAKIQKIGLFWRQSHLIGVCNSTSTVVFGCV